MTEPLPSFMQENVPLASYCTFGIGGPARFFASITTAEEMQQALRFCHLRKIPFFLLGKGSNCLFDDRGFPGAVLCNRISFLEKPKEGLFHVGAGYSFSLLGVQTARDGWSGLEFASGIPATVGGAVYMNAGANGTETCEHLESVDYITADGKRTTLSKKTLQFSYRTSSFQQMKGAIVGATFALEPSFQARAAQIEIIRYRTSTQPYGEKSAGCMFQNPEKGSAGALIDSCGLKGFKIGGAEVSPKHANFIINKSSASAQEVLELIHLIKEKVKKETGVALHSEVRYVPYSHATFPR